MHSCGITRKMMKYRNLIFTEKFIASYDAAHMQLQGDSKRCVPIFCSIKNPFFNECLFCCRM